MAYSGSLAGWNLNSWPSNQYQPLWNFYPNFHIFPQLTLPFPHTIFPKMWRIPTRRVRVSMCFPWHTWNHDPDMDTYLNGNEWMNECIVVWPLVSLSSWRLEQKETTNNKKPTCNQQQPVCYLLLLSYAAFMLKFYIIMSQLSPYFSSLPSSTLAERNCVLFFYLFILFF